MFLKKPAFWVVSLIALVVLIPLSFYFFKTSISSSLSYLSTQIQSFRAAKPGKCLILENHYCSRGKVLHVKNSQGLEEIYIGFNLPEGTPIFAAMDGQTPKTKLVQPGEFQGSRVVVMDPDLSKPTGVGFIIIGDLGFDNMLSLNVKKGEVIARTKNTGIKNLGGYNVIITVKERASTDKTAVTSIQILQELFSKGRL